MENSNRPAAVVNLPLHPKQQIALTCPATEILFGGAASGGKSFLMRAATITYAAQVPGLQVYLFRKTRGDLILNHFTGASSYRDLLAPWTQSGHAKIVLSANRINFWNGSTIHLCFLQRPKDRDRYQGSDIHFLCLDEGGHFTDSEFRWLRSRMRLGGLKIPESVEAKFPRVLIGSNPGGVGHHFLKKGFVNGGELTLRQMSEEEGGAVRCYIPSRMADNPTTDPSYSGSLAGLGDPTLVRAMMDGDWNVVGGSMFGEVWRRELHTCEPFPIPIDWPVWRGADDGFAAPASVLWATEDPETGTIYVIDELYKAGMLPDYFAERTLAHDKRLVRLLPDGTEQAQTQPIKGIMDSAAFGDTGQQNAIPRGHVMNKLGTNWSKSEKWAGSRVDGVQHIHRLLATNPRTGKPGLRFFSTCRNAIEVIPTVGRDKNNPEDIDGDDPNDHVIDSLRYLMLWKKGGFKKIAVEG